MYVLPLARIKYKTNVNDNKEKKRLFFSFKTRKKIKKKENANNRRQQKKREAIYLKERKRYKLSNLSRIRFLFSVFFHELN